MIYLLDTDIFTLAYYKRHGIRERIANVTSSNELAIPLGTRVEVLRGRFEGIRKAANGAEVLKAQSLLDLLEQSEAFLARFRIVLFDAVAVPHFDRIRIDKRSNDIGRADQIIASITLAHAATLVTRNAKDFVGFPGLKLENGAA